MILEKWVTHEIVPSHRNDPRKSLQYMAARTTIKDHLYGGKNSRRGT
jgi:prophage antirepressor-like protein